jgi:hypothetical protein
MPYHYEGERLVFDAPSPVASDPNVIAAPIAPTLLRLGQVPGGGELRPLYELNF